MPKPTMGRLMEGAHPTGSNIFILVIDWERVEIMQTKTVRDALTLDRHEIRRFLQEV